MKKIKIEYVMIFSIGYIQESEQAPVAGTLTILSGCTLSVPSSSMAFGTADNGDVVPGSFNVRNIGNQIAIVVLDAVTPSGSEGDWVDSNPTTVIEGINTAIDDGTITPTTLDGIAGTPIALTNITPDNQGASGAADLTVLVTVTVDLVAPFAGDLFLSLLVVNTGCV